MKSLKSSYEQHHVDNGVTDYEQLTVIFNPAHRLIVEAPAGYGKTKTLISKIAYLILSDQIANTKRVLALTFSVNAAYKIRREILDQLKLIIEDKTTIQHIEERVDASNYHGLCRRLLGRHGYLIAPKLTNIGQFKNVDEDKKSQLDYLPFPISEGEKQLLMQFASDLKCIGKPGVSAINTITWLKDHKNEYLQILLDKFIPNDHITYNGILLLTQNLFDQYPEVLRFYQSYYPAIFVDEFQDTNWLQWEFLNTLVGTSNGNSTNQYIYLFGDRVQRIYGFIGAIPDIFDQAQKQYEMAVKKLLTNHRFGVDTMMGQLDQVLRVNAENIRKPSLQNFKVNLHLASLDDQTQEAAYLIEQVQSLHTEHPDATIAILVRTGIGSNNTKAIYDALRTAKINFFYALFSDEDTDYIQFHQRCLDAWIKELRSGNLTTFKSAQLFLNEFVQSIPHSETKASLVKLLKYHMSKIQRDYDFLSFDEKVSIVTETLNNRALKQHLDLIRDSQVVFSTIHGAKGLEWDYVFLPDLEKFALTPFLCGSDDCRKFGCSLDWTERSAEFEAAFLDELSVFYVAITRAKKNVFFSYSAKSISKKGPEYQTKSSCLVNLPGIVTNSK